jgi:hypothetical protein
MIVGIYGCWDFRLPGEQIKGCGKTLAMVYYLYQDYLDGRRVFANCYTNFTKKMTTHEVYELFRDKETKRVAIGLDEIQKDLNSIRLDPQLVIDFCNAASAQTRKKDVDMYWTTQRALDVDKRLRIQTDIFLRPVRCHSDGKLCNRKQHEDGMKDGEGCRLPHFIRVYDYTDGRNSRQKPIITLSCDAVGELYDTYEVLTDSIN